ncbi:MAG: OmpA family protein [Bacteroidota bacterium]|nr:OmpA family protein [Bacteroidota bacterium]
MARPQTLVIHFDFNKSGLTPQAKLLIDSFLVTASQKKLTGKIELTGHCDFIGSDSYNDSLSLCRVMTVKKYLEAKYDLPGKIVSAIGYGEKKPLNENKTEEERGLNRRVEITIIQAELASVPEQKKVTPPRKEDVSLKEKIGDSTTKAGSNIALKNINFVGGMHQFLPEAYPVLQELLETMRLYPRLVIEIQGHICCLQYDNDGLDAETRNYNLSEERAKAVYEYLVKKGIDAKRLSFRGYGHSTPIYPYPEKTEEERIANRRVEIKIISK